MHSTEWTVGMDLEGGIHIHKWGRMSALEWSKVGRGGRKEMRLVQWEGGTEMKSVYPRERSTISQCACSCLPSFNKHLLRLNTEYKNKQKMKRAVLGGSDGHRIKSNTNGPAIQHPSVISYHERDRNLVDPSICHSHLSDCVLFICCMN